MQVRDSVYYDIEKMKKKNYSASTMSKTNLNNKISFLNNNPAPKADDADDKPKGLTIKKATNILGVAAWIFVVGYSVKKLKLLQPNSPERIAEKVKNQKKQLLALYEKQSEMGKDGVDEALKNSSKKGLRKTFYNLGNGFRNLEMNLGSELFNNLTYAFGTLVVMPLVVLFSPIGKKKTTKEDKTFAVLRQPLSVAATLGMQFTFDKLIGKYVPAVLKNNTLEDKSILKDGKINLFDEKGKVIKDNYMKIQYNADEAKNGFKHLAKEVLDEKEINSIFKNKSYEQDSSSLFSEKLKGVLNDKFNFKLKNLSEVHAKDGTFNGVKADGIKNLVDNFKQLATVIDKNKMAIQKPKTFVNATAGAIIGCTFLNVIYGKSMKAYKAHKDSKIENLQSKNEKKEVK